MPPAAAATSPRHPARRVRGTRVLLFMLIAVLLLTAGLYTVLTRLKLGGANALKTRPAPDRSAAPAH